MIGEARYRQSQLGEVRSLRCEVRSAKQSQLPEAGHRGGGSIRDCGLSPVRRSVGTKACSLAKTQRALRGRDNNDLTLGDLGVFARDIIPWFSMAYVMSWEHGVTS